MGVEVTRVIKIQSSCRDCLDTVLRTMSTLDGILLMKFFNNELVVTYETSNVSFSDIAQLVLSLGIGVLLRKVIMIVGSRGIDIDVVNSSLGRMVDGVVDLQYDQATARLTVIMHPDTDINAVINGLVGLGVPIREVTVDELSQILIARS
ncbi:hypothetical protein Vsou_23980 [Vulcanisaeta souniana JCM 11219]|uniref:Uncharacterized protein n=1 Tax=Vulcanisaeta souniana JCM 11219 TaxID=1293586 RepID=A0A830E855_9CREN|nr:hypothetical protein Vsou_23980 [Vulcanisaeta souniana JCM 11219]GGI79068.1 hypothetical protein GCM10007112_15050 [Vulcanisaeta souniana JCM 11219]